MMLIIALALALAYAAVKPLGEGLFDTSLWVAKILMPSDVENNDMTKQFLKVGQAALMEGWLSNIPFIASLLYFASIVAGFVYHWWGAILMYFVATILGMFTKRFWVRSVSYYLPFLYHKMLNRATDYKAKNDIERAEASESYCRDLERIMFLYQDSHLRPPTPKQLKEVPYGDENYWLQRGLSYQTS